MADLLKKLMLPLIAAVLCSVLAMVALTLDDKNYAENKAAAFGYLQMVVDTTADNIDTLTIHSPNNDFLEYREEYMTVLIDTAVKIDALPSVIGILYDKDFNQISTRAGFNATGHYTDPLQDHNLYKLMKENVSGEYTTWLDESNRSFYWRWIPTETEENFLMVLGISDNTVKKDGQTEKLLIVIVTVLIVVNILNSGIVSRRKG